MKKRKCKFKKVLAVALSTVMMVGAVSLMPGGTLEAKAAAATRDINLGFGGIGNPTSTTDTATAWAGSKVYYGKDGKLWRVLNVDDTKKSGSWQLQSYYMGRLYHENVSQWSE